MQAAQRLQGIEQVGNGQGLITYHRTDSTTLSDKALGESALVIGGSSRRATMLPAAIRRA